VSAAVGHSSKPLPSSKFSIDHLQEVEEGYVREGGQARRGPTLIKLERIANAYGLTVGLFPE
jgi:hypothetical protein